MPTRPKDEDHDDDSQYRYLHNRDFDLQLMTVRLQVRLIKRLKLAAVLEETTVQAIVGAAVEEWLKRHDK